MGTGSSSTTRSGLLPWGLHQGLAQGQPHVMGQEVLAVLPPGTCRPERVLPAWAAPVTVYCLPI